MQVIAANAIAIGALVLRCDLAGIGKGPQRRQQVPELRPHLLVERVEGGRLKTGDVLVERVDEDRQRQIWFELRRRSTENELPTGVRKDAELCDEPRPTDPWLPDQRDGAGLAAVEVVEQSLGRSQLGRPPDQASRDAQTSGTSPVQCDRFDRRGPTAVRPNGPSRARSAKSRANSSGTRARAFRVRLRVLPRCA
jgi:hypothetical protein